MGEFKRVIEAHYAALPSKQYKSMTPSASMLGACPLASYAKLKGVPESTPPDVHAMQNFEVGNVTEAVMAYAFDQQDLLVAWWIDSQNYGATFDQKDWKGTLRDDAWIDTDIGISGSPDITAHIDEHNVLVDIKTASTTSIPFTLRKIKVGTYWDESLGYKYQLGCYLLLAKLRFEAGLETFMPDYGKLVIIDKNTGAIIAEPTLFLDEALEAEIRNRIEYLHSVFKEADETGTLPECDCAIGWKQYFGVSYCNYGVVESIQPNKKKKMVPTVCCSEDYISQTIADQIR